MYRGGELETAGPSDAAATARSASRPDASSATNCTGVAGFNCSVAAIGPTSLGSPQLQQSRRHSFPAIRANGQSELASLVPLGQTAESPDMRNGHVSAWAAGNPARSATTTTAANCAKRFIRLLRCTLDLPAPSE
jgi:hypothetical protein